MLEICCTKCRVRRVNKIWSYISPIAINIYRWSSVQAGEIMRRKLNAGTAALSACSAGLGKLVNGEGVLGHTRAFFHAGERKVAVSGMRMTLPRLRSWNLFTLICAADCPQETTAIKNRIQIKILTQVGATPAALEIPNRAAS